MCASTIVVCNKIKHKIQYKKKKTIVFQPQTQMAAAAGNRDEVWLTEVDASIVCRVAAVEGAVDVLLNATGDHPADLGSDGATTIDFDCPRPAPLDAPALFVEVLVVRDDGTALASARTRTVVSGGGSASRATAFGEQVDTGLPLKAIWPHGAALVLVVHALSRLRRTKRLARVRIPLVGDDGRYAAGHYLVPLAPEVETAVGNPGGSAEGRDLHSGGTVLTDDQRRAWGALARAERVMQAWEDGEIQQLPWLDGLALAAVADHKRSLASAAASDAECLLSFDILPPPDGGASGGSSEAGAPAPGPRVVWPAPVEEVAVPPTLFNKTVRAFSDPEALLANPCDAKARALARGRGRSAGSAPPAAPTAEERSRMQVGLGFLLWGGVGVGDLACGSGVDPPRTLHQPQPRVCLPHIGYATAQRSHARTHLHTDPLFTASGSVGARAVCGANR